MLQWGSIQVSHSEYLNGTIYWSKDDICIERTFHPSATPHSWNMITILLNRLQIQKWKQSTQHQYITVQRTERSASLTLRYFIFPCRLACHLPCKFEEDVWIVWTYLKSKQRQIPIQLVQLLLEQQQSLRWQLHTHTHLKLQQTRTHTHPSLSSLDEM